MNKKFLLLVLPLVFIILNVLPVSAYQQKVTYAASANSSIKAIAVSQSWRIKTLKFPVSNPSFSPPVFVTNTNISPVKSGKRNTVLTYGAVSHGFPFSFYFSQNNPPKTGTLYSPSYISAYSFYWFILDLVIFIVVLLISLIVIFLLSKSAHHLDK